jgi:hypothetical protein
MIADASVLGVNAVATTRSFCAPALHEIDLVVSGGHINLDHQGYGWNYNVQLKFSDFSAKDMADSLERIGILSSGHSEALGKLAAARNELKEYERLRESLAKFIGCGKTKEEI